MKKLKLDIRNFIKYKFLNSLFLGVSVGTIFTIYEPIEPSVYSLGGILLAMSMLLVAKFYYKILNMHYFYKISLLVEFVALAMIFWFLIFSYSYMSALILYTGYHLTFAFGSYLIRAETLFLRRAIFLEKVDVAKQVGYLAGMLLSFSFYKVLENWLPLLDKQAQVYTIYFLLLSVQLLIIYFLLKSFRRES